MPNIVLIVRLGHTETGPHALVDQSKGMVTLMVSPLLALQEEQVSRYV